MSKVTSVVYPVLSLFVGGLFVAACGDESSGVGALAEDAGRTADDAGSQAKDSGSSTESDSAPAGECEGKADGTACGSSTSTECDGADTCKAGVCEKNLAAEGTACGEAPTACTDQGTCDGNGKCNGNPKPSGTECGTASECADADTCDGNGECKSNFKAVGTACGSATTTECDGADTCDGNGTCSNNLKADGTTCGDTSDVACDRADTCLAGECKSNVAADGAFCQDCAAGVGKCGLCSTGACPSLCEAPASTNIETPFDANNNHRGNMFEVEATKDVMILAAEVNSLGGAGTIEIYTHPGALAGTTQSPAAWTLRQTTSVGSDIGRTPLTTDIFVPLTSGTNSVYVTHTNVALSLSYSDGSEVGGVLTDDGTLAIKQGYGKAYPFGQDFVPRNWNGAFRYVPGVTTSYAGGMTDHGEMFDVKASATTSVRALSVNLPAGDHTLKVYFHPGTFVGTEANPAAWTAIGTDIAVKSAGPGVPTAIPIKVDVTIPAGTRYAFYVTTTGGTSLNATAGTAVGTLASAAGALEIYEGAGVIYPFGTVTKGRKPNVTVYHGDCN